MRGTSDGVYHGCGFCIYEGHGRWGTSWVWVTFGTVMFETVLCMYVGLHMYIYMIKCDWQSNDVDKHIETHIIIYVSP